MFKKLCLALLICLFIASQALAANVVTTEVMDTTFNAVTTSDTTADLPIQGYDRVAFFVVYNETEVGNSISAAITIDVSYDGETWLDASYYDYAGGSTLQTSETISADGSYYAWFNRDLCVPYVRVAVALTNTDADDVCDVNVYIAAKE